MFREIVVAGGMFVASFFFDGDHIFAKEPDQSYFNPYRSVKIQNTNSRKRTNPRYRSINNCPSYSKQMLITLLKNGILWKVDYRGRVPLALFREKVEGFCECILKDVHASLCGIVSKYLWDFEYGGFNVSYTSSFLMLERGYKPGLSHSIHWVPGVSYFGLSEDCYRDEELPSFFKQDARILTDFLLKQVLPDYGGTVENLRKRVAIVGKGSAFLDEAVSSAFKERKITLKVFSHFLGSGTMKNMEESNNEFFLRLRNILEEGEIFQNEFIDIFWKTFVERSYAFALFDFFGNYVPVSEIDMAYGLQAFRIYQKREEFQTFSEEELSELSRRITCILKKRNIMLHTILMTVPPGNVEKVQKTEDFFYRMTKVMEDVRDDADSLLDEYQKFSDSQYWKVEKHFDDDEAKKIFDELNDVKSVERKNPSSTISKPTVLPPLVKDVKRVESSIKLPVG